MTLLRFTWGLDDSSKKWVKYRLCVAKGECQEIDEIRRLKELVNKRKLSKGEP